MWFKNLKLYRLSDSFNLDPETLDQQLQQDAFQPCGQQDIKTQGWASPMPGGESLHHSAEGRFWLSLKVQERLLPAAVVNAELAEAVEALEHKNGTPVSKQQQKELKEQIIHRLLPQAFRKNSVVHGFVAPASRLVAVDAASDAKAELFLAHLRKSIGSLPVLPLARRSLAAELTAWLKDGGIPEAFELLEEAELTDNDGAQIRCKNLDLGAEEFLAHIDAGKWVSKLAIQWQERVSLLLQEDLVIKRLKYSDVLKEQNEDIPKDQQLARLDADFVLMSAEVVALADAITQAFELDKE